MRRNLLFLLLISVAVLSACAQSRKTTSKRTPKPEAASTASLKGLSSVSMRRSACFGRCPEYTVTINSNGLAEYSGARNTTPLGVYQKDIGTAAAQELLKEFMDYRADTCRDLYVSRIADLPGLHYTLVINGKKKPINNANFGPVYLSELGVKMDQYSTIDGSWKKISDKAPE